LTEVRVALPEDVAREAEAGGLLRAEKLESLLRTELRRRKVDRLFEAADRLSGSGEPPLTEAELEGEIAAARKARHAANASRR
jgi:hypothetical protein